MSVISKAVPSDRLLTIAEAAQIVGYHYETVAKAIRQGKLRAYRRHKATRIEPAELTKYMESLSCNVNDRSHGSTYAGGDGASHTGLMENAAVSAQVLRMKTRLSRPS